MGFFDTLVVVQRQVPGVGKPERSHHAPVHGSFLKNSTLLARAWKY